MNNLTFTFNMPQLFEHKFTNQIMSITKDYLKISKEYQDQYG